ncbi:glycosyl transferase family 1 [Caulobacter sp. S45]|uniref:glycosyl transferase family 1 n=1 Tax=Caulobacter sp. S45 TaxID=1641861 RepID=UPI00131B8A52|nr:glycosyl transferase family 1 [Caulobacter sp. S45]
MLAIARRAMALSSPSVEQRLIYECLDIHRVMLSGGVKGGAIRLLERYLLKACNLLVVSSPAFLAEYFRAIQHTELPDYLVENKVLLLDGRTPALTTSAPRMPWRIGWFGVIRCRKSLDLLIDLVNRLEGDVEVIIRGRPAYDIIPDFDERISRNDYISFFGPYSAGDLPSHYGDVHFSWLLDYYEEGQNSSWLLPNRLYEGGAFGAVPFALASVQVAAWLREHGIGVVLENPATDLFQFFKDLTPSAFEALSQAVRGLPAALFVADRRDCVNLVDALNGSTD